MLLIFTSRIMAQEKGSACTNANLRASAREVQTGRAALLALPIGDGMVTDVSSDGQRAISAMKDSLGSFINAYMSCVPVNPDIHRIRRELSELSHAYRLPSGQMNKEEAPPDFGKYGFELWFDVQSAHENRLVSIIAAFDIECGSDAVLFIFSSDSGSWREVLRWQSRPYSSIKDAFGAFDSRVSPPDNLGRWYVVTKHIAPWCSSSWSRIIYEALRPRPGDVNPKVLLSRDDFMWWGGDDTGTLTVKAKEFEVRFHSASIDPDVHNRVWIRRFGISGDTVTRVQPVAVSPRDFVDEWLITPWRTAIGWSSKTGTEQLRKEHEELSKATQSAHHLFSFGSIYRCSDTPNHYQVELVEETGPGLKTGSSYYFQVAGNKIYTMIGASRTPDPKCGGQNLRDEMDKN